MKTHKCIHIFTILTSLTELGTLSLAMMGATREVRQANISSAAAGYRAASPVPPAARAADMQASHASSALSDTISLQLNLRYNIIVREIEIK